MKYTQFSIWLCLISFSIFPFLRREGSIIVDESGNEVVFKGFGLGGWLVREGYMLQIESGTIDWPLAHSEIEDAITRLIGREDTDEFFRRYEANFITEADIAQIAAWGCNSIRLPINAKRLQPRKGQPDNPPYVYTPEGYGLIDSCINWCEKYGVRVILDMHCSPGGQTDDHIADPVVKGEAGLWKYSDKYWPMAVELWQKIAERYKDSEIVAGYDILNEPGLEDYTLATILMDSVRHLSEQIVTAIREVDTNHILFIEGIHWSNTFTGMTPPWDSNMVYTFHKYWDENNQASIQKYVNLREQYTVPIFNGETGENNTLWAKGMVTLHDSNNIGWNWWTVKKLDNYTQPFDCPVTKEYQQILDYWHNISPKPDTATAKSALFEIAENFNITDGACELLTDVLTALGLDTVTGTIKGVKKVSGCTARKVSVQYLGNGIFSCRLLCNASSPLVFELYDCGGRRLYSAEKRIVDNETRPVFRTGGTVVASRLVIIRLTVDGVPYFEKMVSLR